MKGRASARSSTRSPRNAWRFRWRTAPSRSTSPSRRGSPCTRGCVAADPILLFGAGLLGLCLRSLLHVGIVRLPNDQPPLSPPPPCPHCKHPLPGRGHNPRRFALLYAVARVGQWVFKEEAMGGGDVKMMAMVGAFLGWKGVLLTIFLGALLGSLIFVPLSLKKKRLVPFGVFLALGAGVTFVAGDAIIAWYLHFLRGS